MGGPSANWEMDLTQAEVVRDQKHMLRTGHFLSAEHFSSFYLQAKMLYLLY